MKRYLVFSGGDYYPAGGWGDFFGDYDTQEEAEERCKLIHGKWRWWHVIDLETGKEVASDITSP